MELSDKDRVRLANLFAHLAEGGPEAATAAERISQMAKRLGITGGELRDMFLKSSHTEPAAPSPPPPQEPPQAQYECEEQAATPRRRPAPDPNQKYRRTGQAEQTGSLGKVVGAVIAIGVLIAAVTASNHHTPKQSTPGSVPPSPVIAQPLESPQPQVYPNEPVRPQDIAATDSTSPPLPDSRTPSPSEIASTEPSAPTPVAAVPVTPASDAPTPPVTPASDAPTSSATDLGIAETLMPHDSTTPDNCVLVLLADIEIKQSWRDKLKLKAGDTVLGHRLQPGSFNAYEGRVHKGKATWIFQLSETQVKADCK